MPSPEAKKLVVFLEQHPEKAFEVDWDSIAEREPDLPVFKLRNHYAELNFNKSLKPEMLYSPKAMGEMVQRGARMGWEFVRGVPKVPVQLYEKLVPPAEYSPKLQTVINPVSGRPYPFEAARIVYNFARGAGALGVGIPQFFLDIFEGLGDISRRSTAMVGATTPSPRPEPKLFEMAKGTVDATAKLAALIKLRMDNAGRPLTTKEQEFYEDITRDPMAVLMPFLIATGAGKFAGRRFAGKMATPEAKIPGEKFGTPSMEAPQPRGFEESGATFTGQAEVNALSEGLKKLADQIKTEREKARRVTGEEPSLERRMRFTTRSVIRVETQRGAPGGQLFETVDQGPQLKASTVAEPTGELPGPTDLGRRTMYKEIRDLEGELAKGKIDNYNVRARIESSRNKTMGNADLREVTESSMSKYIKHLEDKLATAKTQTGLELTGKLPERRMPVEPAKVEEPVVPRETPESIALANNAKFDGMQERPSKTPAYQFTDKQTGSSVLVDTPEALPGRLSELRAKFQEKPTPEPTKAEVASGEPTTAFEEPTGNAAWPTEKMGEIKIMPIKELSTDTKVFQERIQPFSRATVERIKATFDARDFDPIVLWKDPKGGKPVVVDGHSRLQYAVEEGYKEIPTREFKGTKEEAIQYSLRANKNKTLPGFIERLRAYKRELAGGKNPTELKHYYGGDTNVFEDIKTLPENSKFVVALNDATSITGKETVYPNLLPYSRLMGRLKKKFGDKLTQRHFDQVFETLYQEVGGKRSERLTIDEVEHMVTNNVDAPDWSPNKPLVLKRGEKPVTGARATDNTREIMGRIDELKDLKERVIGAAESIEQKAKAREMIATYDAEISKLSDAVKKISEGQGDIFAEKGVGTVAEKGGFYLPSRVELEKIIQSFGIIYRPDEFFKKDGTPTAKGMTVAKNLYKLDPEAFDAARKADVQAINAQMFERISKPEDVRRQQIEENPEWTARQEASNQPELFAPENKPPTETKPVTPEKAVEVAKKSPFIDLFGNQDGKVILDREIIRRIGDNTLAVTRAGFGFARPSRILWRHESGLEMIQRAIHKETAEKVLRNSTTALLDDAAGALNHGDKVWMRENFMRAYEGNIAMPNERIQGFADAWREASRMIATAARSLGIQYMEGGEFTPRLNYFPHWLSEEGRLAMEAGGGTVFSAIMAALERKGMSTEGIKILLHELSPKQEATLVKRAGSLEHPRLLELPDRVRVRGRWVKVLESDPFEVLPSYITRASSRLATVKAFGQGNDLVIDMAKRARAADRMDVSDAIENAWHDIQRLSVNPRRQLGPIYRGFIRPLENVARGPLLSMAQVANVPGYIAIGYKAGLKNTIRAFYESLRFPEEFAVDQKLGAWSTDVMRDLATTEDLRGKSGMISKKILRYTGFEGINEHINRVSARATYYAVEDMLAKIRGGKDGLLQKMLGDDPASIKRRLYQDFFWNEETVSRILRRGLSDGDRARIVQRGPTLVNVMGESVLDRPSWMRHPLMQTMFAYTSFARAMGAILSDALKEVKYGNMKPLAVFLVGQQLAGELEIWLKNYFYNQERTDKNAADRIMNNFLGSMSFGIGGILYEKVKFGIRGGDIGAEAVPPNIAFTADLVQDIYKAVDRGELAKGIPMAISRRIPIIRALGGTTERILSPTTAEEKRLERRQRILGPEYNERYYEARSKRRFGEAMKIKQEARRRGVIVSEQSYKSRRTAAKKKAKEETSIYEYLGSK